MDFDESAEDAEPRAVARARLTKPEVAALARATACQSDDGAEGPWLARCKRWPSTLADARVDKDVLFRTLTRAPERAS